MFEKLIHLIDKWNIMVEPKDQVQLLYGTQIELLIGFFTCCLRNAESKQPKFGTPDIESMYYKMKELYTERFGDPAIDQERFKITKMEPGEPLNILSKIDHEKARKNELLNEIKKHIDANLYVPEEWVEELIGE